MKIGPVARDILGVVPRRMIPRQGALGAVQAALGRSPVAVLSGPRQCGKTTLARELLPQDSANYFDLEDRSASRVWTSP